MLSYPALSRPIDGGRVLRIGTPRADRRPVERIVATWYRIAGIVTNQRIIAKLATLKARPIGGEPAAAALGSIDVAIAGMLR